MRNEAKQGNKRIMALVEKLPYFSIKNLLAAGIDSHYLRILLSRQAKAKKIIRLKKGLYVSRNYLEEAKAAGRISPLLEFLACAIYAPAYLSGEYILYRHNLLTEVPQNFTLMTVNKTARFLNPLGNFIYHTIQPKLFVGFESLRAGDFTIAQASKAKALFDFLYLRKNLITNKEIFKELRLNLDVLSARDRKELKTYVNLEGSVKMKYLYSLIT